MAMEPEIEAVYRALGTLERSMAEQISHLRQQLQLLQPLPIDVAQLTETSKHHGQNVERISEALESNTNFFRQEIGLVREKAEKNNDFTAEKHDSLSKSLTSAADRIESKFSTKIEDLKKELQALTSDYDKRIAALKAVAMAISVAFAVLQGVIGLAISSYVNGWKTRIEEVEFSTKDLKKGQQGQDVLIKELQQDSLSRRK